MRQFLTFRKSTSRGKSSQIRTAQSGAGTVGCPCGDGHDRFGAAARRRTLTGRPGRAARGAVAGEAVTAHGESRAVRRTEMSGGWMVLRRPFRASCNRPNRPRFPEDTMPSRPGLARPARRRGAKRGKASRRPPSGIASPAGRTDAGTTASELVTEPVFTSRALGRAGCCRRRAGHGRVATGASAGGRGSGQRGYPHGRGRGRGAGDARADARALARARGRGRAGRRAGAGEGSGARGETHARGRGRPGSGPGGQMHARGRGRGICRGVNGDLGSGRSACVGRRGGPRARRGDEDQDETEDDRPHRNAIGARADPFRGPPRRAAALDLDEAGDGQTAGGAAGDLHGPAPAALGPCRRLGLRALAAIGSGEIRLPWGPVRAAMGAFGLAPRPADASGRVPGLRGSGVVTSGRPSCRSGPRARLRGRATAARAATLDRLTYVLDVGPPCATVALWHSCLSSSFAGLRG